MARFRTLGEEEEREFWRPYRFYWREAERCEKANAHLAGCVMLGSALEALLILMVNVYDEEASGTGLIPMKKKKGKDVKRPKPLVDWDLAELLRVAKAANWLPAGLNMDEEWNSRKARVGDYAEVARRVRNLVHAGKYRSSIFAGESRKSIFNGSLTWWMHAASGLTITIPKPCLRN